MNPLVHATVEIADNTPMRCEFHNETVVRFRLGSIAESLDTSIELAFEPGALRRFGEMLAAEGQGGPR